MSNKDFWSSLSSGDKGEAYCMDLFNVWKNSGKLKDWNKVSHYVYQHLGIDGENDFVWELPNRKTLGAETKDLAGGKNGKGYSTGVIEVWKDNDKKIRAGWWKATELGILDYLFFVNEFDKTIYVFKSRELKDWIEKNNPPLGRCNDGNKDDKGWITKFGWKDKDKGFFKAFKKENDEWIIV